MNKVTRGGVTKTNLHPPFKPPPDVDREEKEATLSPTSGQQAILMAAVVIGILLMGIQLWLLTVALDLYLDGGGNNPIWPLPLVSGLIFLGGLLTLRLLKRRRRPNP